MTDEMLDEYVELSLKALRNTITDAENDRLIYLIGLRMAQ